MVTRAQQVRCHLLALSGDAWALEQSLFSLVGQQGPRLAVVVHVPEGMESSAGEACARLAPLSETVTLSVARPGIPLTAAEDIAVTVWSAGTLATPEHFSRAIGLLWTGVDVAVAGARRMRLLRQEPEPPYVVAKTWRWTPKRPAFESVAADPAFLGRCVVRREVAPLGLPLDRAAQLEWGRQLWKGSRPVRIDGFPSVDLPDLRPDGSTTALPDRLAELRYQLPRRFERAAPLAFGRARGMFHRLRRSPPG